MQNRLHRLSVTFLVGIALIVPAACAKVAPKPAVGALYTAPSSIDPTGARDVSAELYAFIQHVPDGNTVTFPHNARYRVESTISLVNRNNLVVDGNGATFFATTDGSGATPMGPTDIQWKWPRHRDQIAVWGGTNVVLRNLTVKGANPNGGTLESSYVVAYEAQAGVEFHNSVNATLENCNVSDTYGDFVYIAHDASGTTVRNCTMTRSGRQGISVVDAVNTTLDHNNLSQIARSTFDLETYVGQWAVVNTRITNNTVGPTRLDTLAAKGEGDVSNVLYAYNRHVGVPMQIKNSGAFVGRRHDWSVIGNTSDHTFGSPHGSVRMFDTDHIVVRDNYQPLQSRRNPPQLATEYYRCTDVTEVNNQFPYL
jgi:parallel beta-helix repeat protein